MSILTERLYSKVKCIRNVVFIAMDTKKILKWRNWKVVADKGQSGWLRHMRILILKTTFLVHWSASLEFQTLLQPRRIWVYKTTCLVSSAIELIFWSNTSCHIFSSWNSNLILNIFTRCLKKTGNKGLYRLVCNRISVSTQGSMQTCL